MGFGRFRTAAATEKGRPDQARSAPAPAADDWLQPPPAPEVREGGESMWEAWHEESRRMELAFADTQPSEMTPLADQEAGDSQQARTGDRCTAQELVDLARRHNRVCPQPLLWSALHLLLQGQHDAALPPPPVRRSQWAQLSNLQRRLCFREYIEWADRHGKLETMARYLQSLAEPDWVHMDED